MHRGPLRAAAADAAPAPQGAGPAPGPDTVALRQVFGQYPTGVAVVAVRDARGAPVAMTINSFTTVSLDPPLVAWSIGGRALAYHRSRYARIDGRAGPGPT